MNEKRETFFKDRTHCHADHVVGQGATQQTTAAVGILKAVRFPEAEEDEEEEGREERKGCVFFFVFYLFIGFFILFLYCTYVHQNLLVHYFDFVNYVVGVCVGT